MPRLTDLDLSNPETFVPGVPHELFARLRREAPVHWNEEANGPGFWVVSRYADIVSVNRDATTFSSELGGVLAETVNAESLQLQRLMMLTMDPPRHTKLRKLVNKGFTPRMIGELEEHIRLLANQIIDQVVRKGSGDFVSDVAAELPLQVIAEMMGVPSEDRRKLFDWSNRLIGFDDPEFVTSRERQQEAAAELFTYANGLAEKRRSTAEARSDVLSALLTAQVDGEKLTEMEFDLFFLLLAVAGNETTRNLISHALLALIEFPDQRQRLLDDPSLIGPAVEEMLRWGTPVMYFRRTASRDVELHGVKIRAGDKVTMWHISGNRDETAFDDPYRFDVLRRPNEHLAFGGGGPHFCLGANLARMEIRVMFSELLRRLPGIALDGAAERLRSNFINGIKRMPVRY